MNFNDLIRKVRVEIKLSPWPYEARKVDGFPYELPLVVRSDGYIPALNSESRGALVEYEGKTYKLKGVDPHGNIPKAILARQRKRPKSLARINPFHDHGLSGHFAEPGLDYSPLPEQATISHSMQCGRYCQNEPFGVLRQSEAKNEAFISGIISTYLDNVGFNSPYIPIAQENFENLFFNNKETAQIVLEIPSAGSDLRLNELMRLILAHKPDPEATFEIYKKISEWNGFSAKIHNDLKLSPIDRSLGYDNYVLSRVSAEGIRLIKNDHGSTKPDYRPSENKLKEMEIGSGIFVSGRYDRRKVGELKACFESGLKEVPEPIPESEIMALFE